MKAQVLFRERKGLAQSFSLKGSESVLGRDAEATVSIPKDGISRRHARILRDKDAYTLEDLGSTNGTFLNGHAVAREQLRHLDVIGLGREIELIFLLRPDEAETLKKLGILAAALVREASGTPEEPIPPGELTLGRSDACNVILARGAVSKLHCRVVRTQAQLSIEDLGSSNGTFVNGERVRTAVLHDGDRLGIADVEVFRVRIELGEMESPAYATPAATGTGQYRRFSADWKTRYEWDPSEQAELARFRQELRDEEAASRKLATVGEAGASAQGEGASRVKNEAKGGGGASQGPRPAGPPSGPGPGGQGVIVEVRLVGRDVDLGITETGSHAVGRAPDSAVLVPDDRVSRRHATLVISDDRTAAYAKDRGGASGTRVNGVLISGATLLNDGDTLSLGEVALKVSIRRR